MRGESLPPPMAIAEDSLCGQRHCVNGTTLITARNRKPRLGDASAGWVGRLLQRVQQPLVEGFTEAHVEERDTLRFDDVGRRATHDCVLQGRLTPFCQRDLRQEVSEREDILEAWAVNMLYLMGEDIWKRAGRVR